MLNLSYLWASEPPPLQILNIVFVADLGSCFFWINQNLRYGKH